MLDRTSIHVALIFGLLLAGAPATAAPSTKSTASRAEIQCVADRFQQAVIAKDKTTLESLFLPAGVAWFYVLSDDVYAKERARDGQAQQLVQGSPAGFIADVVSNGRASEERFHNQVIDTDGNVASLTFDYDFLVDGKVENSGHEIWQLVRVGGEWKICALSYSIAQSNEG